MVRGAAQLPTYLRLVVGAGLAAYLSEAGSGIGPAAYLSEDGSGSRETLGASD
jgi:hypothetical protein